MLYSQKNKDSIIVRDILFLIILGLLSYVALSTFVADAGLMGKFGTILAHFNHYTFGYVSYIYLPFFMGVLFYMYKHLPLNLKHVELFVSSLLLFFSALILQAVVISNDMRGSFGAGFVDFMTPFIGLFGVLIFWLLITMVTFVILLDVSIYELFGELKNKMLAKKPTKALALKRDNIPKKVVKKPSKKVMVTPPNEEVERSIEESDSMQEPTPETSVETQDDELDKPTFMRQESLTQEEIQAANVDFELPQEEPLQENAIESTAQESGVLKESNVELVEELEENKKFLESIEKGKVEKPKNFKLPTVDFLAKPPKSKNSVNEAEIDEKIKDLIDKLAHFKIDGDVVRTYAGPVVSTFEFKPAANIKVSKILNLQDDLAMALRAETIRIQAPIPGKDVVGIEIPNQSVETIYLREIFESQLFIDAASPLTIVLGKDIVGKPFVTDLKKLPHLLIAGTTGSGKSVGINAMILSLLYKNSPDQLRLLMIDPKMLEFSIYNDIPHLLTPVITKAKQAIVALNNMVHEMERRYQLMSDTRTKNIENYNEKAKKNGDEIFPYIVVVIDELADLMMTSGKEVEFSIGRLAQMARASGIHLIVATQRPSVDVVTGLIKANLPSRISYKVGQRIDSKIILDAQGAESLLGRGDMLFTPPGSSGLIRLHAPWSSEEEIEEIVEFIKAQREPQYDKAFISEESELAKNGASEGIDEELDELYNEAKEIVLSDKKTSISYLQRRLQIGYNRSARIIEQLEQNGVISAPNNKGNREIL